jgi:hypothetical protein
MKVHLNTSAYSNRCSKSIGRNRFNDSLVFDEEYFGANA